MYLSVLHQCCAVITRIKRADSCRDDQQAAFQATADTQKKWWALFSVFIISVYLLPYLANMDTNVVTIGACQWSKPK